MHKARAPDLLLDGANPWPSRWLLSDGMADGGACLQTHCRLAGWYGPITCRGLQAQDRVLAHAARRAPCPGPCTCQISYAAQAIRTPPSAQAKTEPPFGDVLRQR